MLMLEKEEFPYTKQNQQLIIFFKVITIAGQTAKLILLRTVKIRDLCSIPYMGST